VLLFILIIIHRQNACVSERLCPVLRMEVQIAQVDGYNDFKMYIVLFSVIPMPEVGNCLSVSYFYQGTQYVIVK
jgi:hypothetical protein